MTFKTLFLGFCIMSFSLTGWAHFYQVDHVVTKATAQNAKEAKNQAIEQAQVLAFSRLMHRLTGKEISADKMPEVNEIVSLVQEMSIQDEKNTATDYWATLQVGFQSQLVQSFLKKQGWDYIQKEPPRLLVIPVYKKGDVVLSGLEEENPLYQFLRQQEILSDFYSLELPHGDLDEIVLVNQNLKHSSSWNKLVQRYGVDGILLLQAEEVGEAHWQLIGDILIEDTSVQKEEVFDWYQGYSLPQAWGVFIQQLENKWRENQKSPEEKVFYARLTEPSLQAWVQDKKNLEKLKFIKNVLVQGAFHDQMLISYVYEGNPSNLVQDWQKAGWIWQGDFIGPNGTLTRKEVVYE